MERRHAGGFFYRYRRELLCFFLPIGLMLAYNLLRFGQLAVFGPDAALYLSIADNFLATGHFIETARGGQWVVPFGFPLILTVFRALHMSLEGIVVVQYALLGWTCLLLYKAEVNFFGRGGRAPIVYFLMVFRLQMTPRNALVELYFLFLLVWIFYLLSRKDMPPARRLVWLNAAGFAAFVTRTVLIVAYLPILVYTLVCWRRGQLSGRRTALLFLVPALVMGANTAVNYRETGHWIVTDNYSGRDFYVANNPCTKPTDYLSDLENYVGDEYYAVQADETLDFTEKNDRYKELAGEWIRRNPRTFLKNAGIKFYRLFFVHWLGLLIPPLAFAAVWIVRKKDRLMLLCVCLGFALAVTTSMGLAVGRYTAPLIPLISLQYAAGWELLGELRTRILERKGKKG